MANNEIIKTLQQGQAAYERMKGKTVHYVYLKGRTYQELVFTPNAENFMHLTGYKYYDENVKKVVGAEDFYDLLKDKHMKPEGLRKQQYAKEKADVIKFLNMIWTCQVRIIDDGVNLVKLKCSAGIRTSKLVFCVGVNPRKPGAIEHIPVSLINLKTEKRKFSKGNEVHCVYEVDHTNEKITQIARHEKFTVAHKKKAYTYAYNYEVSEI